MDYDKDRVDEAVLALLSLTMFDDHSGMRAWKGHDWDAMDRLHAKGYISDPKGKAKSVVVTEEGVKRSLERFLSSYIQRGGIGVSCSWRLLCEDINRCHEHIRMICGASFCRHTKGLGSA